MFIRIFGLFVLAFALCGTQVRAASSANCTPGDGFIACQFSPTVTSATFDFGTDGVFTFQFDTVLTPFELDVTAVENAPFTFTGSDFPVGTDCIRYTGPGGSGSCVRYNVTGANGGPVPVKDVNFRGLITETLNYNSEILVQIPAFGHAPGDTTTAPFSENILTLYVDPTAPSTVCPSCDDPGMGGKTPGISSFEAFTIPFSIQPGDTVCSLTALPQNSTSGNNPIVEVSFSLVAAGGDCTTGPFLRDKTATLSVGTVPNPANGIVAFTTLVNGGDSNKFHFDNKDGLNVQDINTNGLVPGTKYYVTVISDLFPPVTTNFTK